VERKGGPGIERRMVQRIRGSKEEIIKQRTEEEHGPM